MVAVVVVWGAALGLGLVAGAGYPVFFGVVVAKSRAIATTSAHATGWPPNTRLVRRTCAISAYISSDSFGTKLCSVASSLAPTPLRVCSTLMTKAYDSSPVRGASA